VIAKSSEHHDLEAQIVRYQYMLYLVSRHMGATAPAGRRISVINASKRPLGALRLHSIRTAPAPQPSLRLNHAFVCESQIITPGMRSAQPPETRTGHTHIPSQLHANHKDKQHMSPQLECSPTDSCQKRDWKRRWLALTAVATFKIWLPNHTTLGGVCVKSIMFSLTSGS
jgi:hypothetical protein